MVMIGVRIFSKLFFIMTVTTLDRLKKFCGLFLLAICLLLSVDILASEKHPLLDSFTVVQINNTAQINFAMKGGASCVGVQLERAGEDLVFQQVDEISGVCGGSEFVEHYSMSDSAPIEGERSLYRLVMGSQGVSTAEEFIFVVLQDGLAIFPNPAKESTTVKFSNPNGAEARVMITGMLGQAVFEETIATSQIRIPLNGIQSGIYFVEIQMNSMRVVRRLVVG